MRARQVSVARQAGRRRLKVLGALSGVGVLIAAGIALLHSPVLAARHITIDGATHTSRASILVASGLIHHPPLIDIQAPREEAAIDRLPWVDTSRVVLGWPESVIVTIVERTPAAEVVLGGARYALVDMTGRVLQVATVRRPGLVEVEGARSSLQPGEDVSGTLLGEVQAAGSVPVALLALVAGVTTSAANGIEIDLAHGPVAILGTATQLREKMIALATVLDRVRLTGVVTIDLRVPSDPVLTS